MAGNKLESGDLADASKANLAANYMELNQKDTEKLIEVIEALELNKVITRVYALGLIPTFKKILILVGANPKTSKYLRKKIILLEQAALRPPQRFHAGLVHMRFVECMNAITTSIDGSSSLKSVSFLQGMTTALSSIGLMKNRTLLPESLVNFMRKNAEDD